MQSHPVLIAVYVLLVLALAGAALVFEERWSRWRQSPAPIQLVERVRTCDHLSTPTAEGAVRVGAYVDSVFDYEFSSTTLVLRADGTYTVTTTHCLGPDAQVEGRWTQDGSDLHFSSGVGWNRGERMEYLVADEIPLLHTTNTSTGCRVFYERAAAERAVASY